MNPIEAIRGDKTATAVQGAKASAAAQQLRPGPGTLITKTPFGFSISGRSRGANFHHPFTPFLVTDTKPGIKFSRGIVTGDVSVEPKIGDVPISGDAKHAQPTLFLDVNDIDAKTQQSWACVEVTPNDAGHLDKDSKVVIVHRNSPISADEAVGRHPLALILWSNGKPGRVFELTFFNLKYVRTSGTGNTRKTHYFL